MSDNEDFFIKLMQNIVDKLDEISSEIDKSNNNDNKALSKEISPITNELKVIPKKFNEIIANQIKLANNFAFISENIEKTIKEHRTPITNSTKTEIIIFGKDSPFSSKLLLISTICLLIFSCGFKYIPNYLKEQNAIELKTDKYKMFYDHLYLTTYENDNNGHKYVSNIFEQIEKKDTSFRKEHNRLLAEYSKKIKKKKLQQQLTELK